MATKTDKLRPEELAKTLAELQRAFGLPQPPVAFSSMTGVGRKDVWRAIRDGITGAGGVDEEDDEDEGEEEDEYNEDEEDF